MKKYPPTRSNFRHLRFTGLALLLVAAIFAFGVPVTEAQTDPPPTISFNSSGLAGENLNNPTSLQFGPDGRLYVSQQNGIIFAYQVQRNGANDYEVAATEEIDLVQDYVPNHDDDGTAPSSQGSQRQITGIYVTGTGLNPILYVSSSDSRIGAGGGGQDKNLDTNSGVVSRLTCDRTGLTDACQWEKVDIVRGLPRSEENHSVNGMQLQGDKLFLAVGGLANAGSPSNNFAFITEYYHSAAILQIDLTKINALPIQEDTTLYNNYTYKWVFDMPTLDDPTRDNLNGINDPSLPGYDGIDPNDPFGGNDGLNQSRHDPTGTVSIYSPGWRNLYDIVITEQGRMYGVDNGANANWGGHPEGEQDYNNYANEYNPAVGPTCTNNYLVGEPGSVDVELPDGSKTSIGVGPGGDDKVNNKNGMHYIRPLVDGDWNFIGANLPYYGGHPAPTRGNPAGAGLYTKGSHTVDPNDGGDDYWRNQILSPGSGPNASDTFKQQSLPVDWPPSPRVGDDRINGDPIPNPVECDFRNSGQDDNAIANYGPSTNGITEYTASNFEGQLEGLLIVASFNGVLYQVQLDETGEIATNCPTPPQNGTSTLGNCQGGDDEFAKNFGATPLDVTAQGDNEIFGGTVWAATYGADNITIFEPADYDGQDTFICTSENSDLLDEDGDTYTNADEIANGTNECSGASQPADFDMAFEFGAQNQFRRSNLLDNDDDNDGLLDFGPIGTVDRFPQDCSNGIAGTCESGAQPPQVLTIPAELDFFQATGYGLVAGIGFTGVMTNGADYLTLLDHLDGDDRIVAGGTAGILTDPIVQPGTADGSTNSQLNGFQFALDVDSTNAPYSIEAQVNKTSGYLDGNPTDSQEGGIFIGTGDQDNFLKLVLRNSDTNDGTLAFGVYMESAGSEVYSYVEDVPAGTADAVAIYLYLSVDPAAGTVQPQFNLGGNTPRTDIGSAVSLPANSDILKVIQGTYTINGTPSGLAAGVIATSKDTQPYGFTWDYIYATENPSNAQAFVEVDTGGINSSTFGNGSFNITNNSEPGIEITKVTVDLETAMLPEIVFDPNGTAGDNVGKGFTPNNGSGTTTGVTTSNFASAYEGGFYDLEINFNDFNPGETLQFGVDIDPISTKGAAQPGPNESASVSGLELAGSTVTIEFSNGDTHVVELFRKPNTDGGTNNIVRNQLPAAPSINAAGVSNQSTVFTDDLTINVVTNTLEQDVKLLQFEAGQFKQADGGYSIDPWEINSLVAVAEYAESTGNSTSVAFNTTLTNQQPDDEEYGFNIFAAVAVDSDGATGPLSNFIIVKYDPNAVPDVDLRINAGGPSFTDSDNNTWEADQHFVNGSTFSNANTVDTSAPGASDQQLYSTERYNAALQYEIPLQPGAYTVELHFAEIYFGAPGGGSAGGVGSRVFDVVVEGDTKLAGYDIVADVGAVVATVKTFQNVQVLDGNLSLAFNASTNNGKISGIRVYGFSDDNAEIPISLTAIANQTSIEGADSTISIAASGGDGNLAYSANGLPLGLSVEPTNGQIFGTIAADASAGGPNNDGIYTVTVTVDDSDDNDADAQTTTFTWTVLPPPTGGAVLARINVGGPQLAAADGTLPVWSADTGANPSPYLIAVSVPTSGNPAIYTGNAGSAHTGNITADSSVPPAAPIEMFNTERYDLGPAPEMLWQFNDIVNTGDEVIVRLYFAELFGQITAPGERVFSVSVEGTTPAVYTDIDPFAVAGAKGAFMLEHPVTVDSDGVLDIEFIHGVENPAIKGIEIVAAEAIDNDPPQIVAVDDITVDEGVEASTSFSATDADSDPITLSFAIVNDSSSVAVDEADYTFTDNTDGTGSFSWTPGAATAGAYTATLTASDGISAPAVEQFAITVIGTGGTPQAIVQINPSSGGLDSSTFGNGFIINNTSPDLNITSVSY
ncbi:MAG: malectin domain-containing carbohydrate-binding protein, partial [Chloroflexota bacterium]